MGMTPVGLAIQPPQQPQGPIQMAEGALSVQAMIAQDRLRRQAEQSNAVGIQQQQLQLQQQQEAETAAQQEQADAQKFRQAYTESGGDWATAIKNAKTSGVGPQFIAKAEAANLDHITKLAGLTKTQLENADKPNELVGQAAQAVLDAPDDQKDQVYHQQRNSLILGGVAGETDIPAARPSDDALHGMVSSGLHLKDNLEQARKIKEDAAKLPGERAKATTDQLATVGQLLGNAQDQTSWTAGLAALKKAGIEPTLLAGYAPTFTPEQAEQARKNGIAPQALANAPVDRVELADFLKHPPKGFQATPTEFLRYKASLAPTIAFNLASATGAGQPAAEVAKKFGMSPEAFDMAAEKYFQTGTLPPVGRGNAGYALQKAIQNRTAELHSGESLAESSAAFKANEGSLKNIQKTFDNVTAFENTAGKNLDVFLQQAKKVTDSGLPVANLPARYVAGKLGSADQAAFETARTTALTEIAKVLSSAQAGSGVLSDSARHEVEGLIKPDATLAQITAAANILKTDMANRHDSYATQIKDIQQRIGGKKEAASSVPANVAKALASVSTGRHKLSDGSTWDKKADGSIVKVP